MIKIGDHKFAPFISAEKIHEAICNVASQINREYEQVDDKPVFLVTLSGAMHFAADLTRALDFLPQIGFVKCSSYGNCMTSSHDVKLKVDPTIEVADKDIIVLEDIIDTGLTWKFLKKHLYDIGVKRARIATMLARESASDIDWAGLTVGDGFLIGMGLDYMNLGRNLPDIYIAE